MSACPLPLLSYVRPGWQMTLQRAPRPSNEETTTTTQGNNTCNKNINQDKANQGQTLVPIIVGLDVQMFCYFRAFKVFGHDQVPKKTNPSW